LLLVRTLGLAQQSSDKVVLHGDADGFHVQQESRRLVGHVVHETGERLHGQRRAHDDQQVALRKVLRSQRVESIRQTLAKEHNVGLDDARALGIGAVRDLVAEDRSCEDRWVTVGE